MCGWVGATFPVEWHGGGSVLYLWRHIPELEHGFHVYRRLTQLPIHYDATQVEVESAVMISYNFPTHPHLFR